MSRFQRELAGELGDFWKRQAEHHLEKIKADLAAGEITIDAEGVARNCIGRVLMDDLLEQLCMVTDKVSASATRAAREAEERAFLAEYKAQHKTLSAEEKIEMQAVFGEGSTVVDVLTGEKYQL